MEPSNLTDPVPPPASRFRQGRTEKEALEASINDCEAAILQAMAEEDRDVWTAEQFEDVYGPDIATQAIDRLRKAQKIAVAEERGLRGRKAKVIRRR